MWSLDWGAHWIIAKWTIGLTTPYLYTLTKVRVPRNWSAMTLKASPLNGSWSLGFRVIAFSGSFTAEPWTTAIGDDVRCREPCCVTPATRVLQADPQDMCRCLT